MLTFSLSYSSSAPDRVDGSLRMIRNKVAIVITLAVSPIESTISNRFVVVRLSLKDGRENGLNREH